MSETNANCSHAGLIVPRMQSVYKSLDGVAWLALRVATGVLLVPHGAQKLFGAFGGGGIEGTTKFLESVGYPSPGFLALLIGLVEFFGGLCLVLGLLTRPAAVAVAIFMAGAVSFHLSNGFFWTAKGFEYPFLWGVAAFFFAVKGGGKYSLDARIGRQF